MRVDEVNLEVSPFLTEVGVLNSKRRAWQTGQFCPTCCEADRVYCVLCNSLFCRNSKASH